MVEEHVGKRRRKEVRQAVSMQEELRKSLLLIIAVLFIGIIMILVLFALSFANVIDSNGMLAILAPLIVMLVVFISVCPRAGRWWSLRNDYKAHLRRYNISKEDMAALKTRDC